ncbi:hypothetical protein H5C81_05115 [Escherichia coli]|nr:hypothetical protein H5C81_05115 [Escherichia coli]
MPLTTETALLSCIKQAREDVLTLRHLQPAPEPVNLTQQASFPLTPA